MQKVTFLHEIKKVNSFLLGCVLVGSLLFSVYLSNTIKFQISDSPHDGGLFLELAKNLINADWLGKYDNKTLAKDPGFALYLMVIKFFQISLNFAVLIQYWILVALFGKIVYKVFRNLNFSFLSMIFLLLYPIQVTVGTYRDIPYAIALVSLLLCFYLLYQKSEEVTESRKKYSLFLNPYFVLFTLNLSFISITKNDFFIILLVIGFFLVFDCVFNIKKIPFFIIMVSIVSSTIFITQVTIRSLNYMNYKVFLTNDFYQGNFSEMYSELQSFRPDLKREKVPISKQQRLEAYEISGNFIKLKSELENSENGWLKQGCERMEICDDFPQGWAPWAIRDAMSSAGYFHSADKVQQFSSSVLADVRKACESKNVTCESEKIGVRNINDVEIGKIIGNFQHLVFRITTMYNIENSVFQKDVFKKYELAQWRIFRESLVLPEKPSYNPSEYNVKFINSYIKSYSIIAKNIIILSTILFVFIFLFAYKSIKKELLYLGFLLISYTFIIFLAISYVMIEYYSYSPLLYDGFWYAYSGYLTLMLFHTLILLYMLSTISKSIKLMRS
jgi:hypothetical protein